METFVQVTLVLIPIISAILVGVSPLGRRSRLKELSDSWSILKGNGYDNPQTLENISDAIARESSYLQPKEVETGDSLRKWQNLAIWGMSFIAVSSIALTAINEGTENALEFLKGLGVVYIWIAFVLGLILLAISFVGILKLAIKFCCGRIKARMNLNG